MEIFVRSLCSLPYFSRVINQGGFRVEYIGEKRNACRILVCVWGGGGGELEGEIPLETLRRGSKNILGLI